MKSDIPEGATHKSNDKFYKKGKGIWLCYHRTGWFHSHTFSDGISAPTPIKQDKEMNIDWNSKDAEGCDWALYCKEVDIVNFYTFEPSHGGERWHCESTVFDGYPSYPHYKLHTRPKAKEMIYTKQMQDAGRECEVGMKFQSTNGGIYKKLLPSDADGMTVVLSNGEYSLFDQSCIMPIDTRTDREKAIDDVAHTLKANGYEDSVLAICIINSLVDIKALTFTENKND